MFDCPHFIWHFFDHLVGVGLMRLKILLAALLLVAGCQTPAADAGRYRDCVALWSSTTKRQPPRTFNKDVHEACLHVSGIPHGHEEKTDK